MATSLQLLGLVLVTPVVTSFVLVFGCTRAYVERARDAARRAGVPFLVAETADEARLALDGSQHALVVVCAETPAEIRNRVVDAAHAARAQVRWVDVADQEDETSDVLAFWIEAWVARIDRIERPTTRRCATPREVVVRASASSPHAQGEMRSEPPTFTILL